MPGWRSISVKHARHLLGGAHQRIDMLDRLIVGIMGHRGARDGVQRLAGRVGDQMHVEEAGHAIMHTVDKNCGWDRGKTRAPVKPRSYTGRAFADPQPIARLRLSADSCALRTVGRRSC